MKYTICCISLLYFFSIFCTKAYAYLDPASGNALVSFFIAILGSLLFFFKSIYYKISSRFAAKVNIRKSNHPTNVSPLIFSEGKTYWTTFRPIVEEFIRQKKYFQYVSLDIHDPGLAVNSEFMHAKLYSKNRLGFAKIATLNAPIMLSTTPNIGCKGYPMVRPSGVKKMIHVFHAMVDVSCYRKGSLDFYDTVFMTGKHEEKSIRQVENSRNLKEKELVVAGLPCLDDLYRQKQELMEQKIDMSSIEDNDQTTLVVAPSWGAKGCLSQYGTKFIRDLAMSGFKVIVRPHPHSHIFEPESIAIWKIETQNIENITWDSNVFGIPAMSKADLLISDTSSVRFDFVFLYNKPVISMEISKEHRSIFESDYMEETWADCMSSKIGAIVNQDCLSQIVDIAKQTMAEFSEEIMEDLRNEYVANFGSSASVIVEYIDTQAKWLSLSEEERFVRENLKKIETELVTIKDHLGLASTDHNA